MRPVDKFHRGAAVASALSEGGSAGLPLLVLILFFVIGAYFGYEYLSGRLAPAIIGGQTQAPEAVEPAATGTTGTGALEEPASGVEAIPDVQVVASAPSGTPGLSELREAYARMPGSAETVALAEGLNREGVRLYGEGDHAGAAELFKEALSLVEDPAHRKNLAMALMKAGDLEGAAEAVEPLSNDNDVKGFLKGVYLRLGETSLDGRDRASAIRWYEKALGLDSGDEALAQAVEKLKREHSAESGMTEKAGGHFTVRFDGTENAVAGHLVALVLEEAYIKVGSDLGFYPDEPIEAVLYSTEQFRDVTRSPSWSGAIFDGRIKIPAGGLTEKTEELERVIFHEYTHALVHRLSRGRAPTWLNEGLAQYEEDGSVRIDGKYVSRIVTGTGFSLRRLEGSFMGLSPAEAKSAYLVSRSATGYLVREFGLSSAVRLLKALGEGRSIDGAMSGAIYLSFDDFERSWKGSLGS